MSEGYWDIQNHILPGIDNGSSSLKETQELLEEEYRQGVRHIVFTPHYRPGKFDVPPAERERVFRNTCVEFQQDYPDLHFYLGCENYVYRQVFHNLNDPRCRMGGGRAVLLRFDSGSSYKLIRAVTEHTVKGGCRPLIAHAEYYDALGEDTVRRVRDLQAAGAWIQIDAESVLGDAGSRQARICETLLTTALVDVITSDAYNMTAKPVRIRECVQEVRELCGPEACEILFKKNPARLLQDV